MLWYMYIHIYMVSVADVNITNGKDEQDGLLKYGATGKC